MSNALRDALNEAQRMLADPDRDGTDERSALEHLVDALTGGAEDALQPGHAGEAEGLCHDVLFSVHVRRLAALDRALRERGADSTFHLNRDEHGPTVTVGPFTVGTSWDQGEDWPSYDVDGPVEPVASPFAPAAEMADELVALMADVDA